jgi:hypothetical protein
MKCARLVVEKMFFFLLFILALDGKNSIQATDFKFECK